MRKDDGAGRRDARTDAAPAAGRPAKRTEGFGESVIREMTRLAHRYDAVNLAQGFPDFPAPGEVKAAAVEAILADLNQYAVTWGSPALRAAIASSYERRGWTGIDAETEITVACGATETLTAVFLALVEEGSEVLVFEPLHEAYAPAALLSGARVRPVPLHAPSWTFDAAELRAAITPRTRAIVLTNPHNPTGRVFTRAELEAIAEVCREADLIAVTDEIYEHIVYEGRHEFLATLPGMCERTITVSALSKTYAVTGWRVGWAVARPELTAAIRKVHDFLTIAAPAPFQAAGVVALSLPTGYYDALAADYRLRRDRALGMLEDAGLSTAPPQGAYYALADVRPHLAAGGFADSSDYARWLVREARLAVVPGPALFLTEGAGRSLIRIAFPKRRETLELAAERLVDAAVRLGLGTSRTDDEGRGSDRSLEADVREETRHAAGGAQRDADEATEPGPRVFAQRQPRDRQPRAASGQAAVTGLRRVLVANRGEIAVRVIRACRDMGIESVAVYSDADRAAPHVRLADRAVRIGPAPAAESYLRIDAILEAARVSGADAVHPGYGFLSERAAFADACEAAGLAFVGPAPATIAGLGDKLAARRAASAAGVPVVPGTLEPAAVETPDGVAVVAGEAERIGWPLMVKAAAGGGGRGMRLVEEPDALPDALLAASREAAAAFGDGSVYLERFVGRARHVEVQLLGDGRGTVVALGERDCSVQRRHQKLVEEAPAPGLDAERRRYLHGLAVAVGSAFALRSAATAEFLLSPEGDFWFLEVNTRLQVEHGVTELVSGLDLVREQLRIAAGEGLSADALAAAERAAEPRAHAIEVRVGAEDPGRGFVPVAGRLARWREPAGPGVRVDSGVEEGSVIGTDYDPLLAKLLVVGRDRPEATARLRRALAEFEIAGLQTTLPFHAWIAANRAFVAADLSTAFVSDHWDPGPLRDGAARRAMEAAAGFAAEEPPGGTAGRRRNGATWAERGSAAEPGRWAAAGRREATEGWPA